MPKRPTGEKGPGAPAAALPVYPGQERFHDGDFQVREWTAELALQVLDVDQDAPLIDKRMAAVDAEESAALPPDALAALRAAGILP